MTKTVAPMTGKNRLPQRREISIQQDYFHQKQVLYSIGSNKEICILIGKENDEEVYVHRKQTKIRIFRQHDA